MVRLVRKTTTEDGSSETVALEPFRKTFSEYLKIIAPRTRPEGTSNLAIADVSFENVSISFASGSFSQESAITSALGSHFSFYIHFPSLQRE